MQTLLFFIEGFEGTHDGLCMRYLNERISMHYFGTEAIAKR
jgi:hypothetical protein